MSRVVKLKSKTVGQRTQGFNHPKIHAQNVHNPVHNPVFIHILQFSSQKPPVDNRQNTYGQPTIYAHAHAAPHTACGRMCITTPCKSHLSTPTLTSNPSPCAPHGTYQRFHTPYYYYYYLFK